MHLPLSKCEVNLILSCRNYHHTLQVPFNVSRNDIEFSFTKKKYMTWIFHRGRICFSSSLLSSWKTPRPYTTFGVTRQVVCDYSIKTICGIGIIRQQYKCVQILSFKLGHSKQCFTRLK
jgi:hypothetical protein